MAQPTARRKYKRNYAWMPPVWEYLKTKRRKTSSYISYEEIIENAHLLGVDTMHRNLKSSKICPNKLKFAKIMSVQEGIEKERESITYGNYLWRMRDEYRQTKFKRGEVII
tara:strand:+ start:8625 stop:8957 length:333 start_codon:yes stop_codon:yes gene_type:complete